MNLTVKQKLMMIVIPALIGLIYLSIQSITAASTAKSASIAVQNLVELVAVNSRLVHELQKERGASAGYLGSKGASFGDNLKQQQLDTNKHFNDLKEYLIEFENQLSDFPEVMSNMDTAISSLERLSAIRSGVTNMSIPGVEAIGYYTNINAQLLSVASIVIHESTEPHVATVLVGFYSFLQGKERAGIERAVLSSVFGNNAFAPGQYDQFSKLLAEQNTYFSFFHQMSDDAATQFFDSAMRDPSVAQVTKYREYAVNRDLNQNAQDWFSQSTKRINLLKLVDDEISAEVIEITVHDVAARTRSLWILSTLALSIIIIVSGISTWLIRTLSKQLLTLKHAMDGASNKDLTVRSEKISGDELGNISVQLNDMLENFAEAVKTITSSSEQLATASEETTATVKENSRQLSDQQSEVLQVVSAIEEMSASIREVATNVSNTSEAATSADELVSASTLLVTESLESIEAVSTDIGVISDTITELHENSGNISNIINVIKSIAEQTNLLALNAAIEAARAGEQGRGFAVVADEVRSLALRTQESTAEIEGMIGKIQEDSTQAFSQMSSSRENVKVSVEKANSVNDALANIVSSITDIRDMAAQIAAAAEEQVAVSAEIAEKSQSIGDNAQATATGGEQIAVAATEQSRLATSLKDLASEFRVE